MLIYKIFRAPEWAALRTDGTTRGAPIDLADGYIHFSTAEQAAETAARHFAGQDDLFLVAVDTDRLGDALKMGTFARRRAVSASLPRNGAGRRALGAAAAADGWRAPVPGGHGMTHIDPTRSQFDAFKDLDRDQPIEMLNLVAFNDLANYPGDHELARDGLTGAQAYGLYGRHSAPVLDRVGGTILWRGTYQTTLIGPADETWDTMFIARYPTAHAFLAMVSDPEYQRAVVHRQAAVRTSRLIRTVPADRGGSFG